MEFEDFVAVGDRRIDRRAGADANRGGATVVRREGGGSVASGKERRRDRLARPGGRQSTAPVLMGEISGNTAGDSRSWLFVVSDNLGYGG